MTGNGTDRTPPEERGHVPRGPLLALMLGSLVVGVGLMVPFEATITRILGVIALFTFIISGVFLIADPAWLERDPD
ncbi:MAG: hypothetical protein QOD44_1358 [Solirubrobacteraceae bacterium]|nr:hypothetical protein [Solirubrobacteraceae bacterium]